MRARLRRNAVAYLALFVALGGTSYAATSLSKNSVGAAQIRRNAVNSAKVKDRSLLARDFKAGELPAGAQGPPGPQGAGGAAGPGGAAGAQGPAGPGAVKLLRITSISDGKPAVLATVGPLTITDTCSSTISAVTNSISFSSPATGAAYQYDATSRTDGGTSTPVVGSGTNVAFGPTAPAGGHTQVSWVDLVYSDDAGQVVTLSFYVRAQSSGEECRVVGSAVPAA
jgi:hypothetical protein